MKVVFDFIVKYWIYIAWGTRFVYGILTKKYTGVVTMALYETLKEEVNVMVAAYRVATADKKVTMEELWSLFQKASFGLVRVAEQVGGTGVEKKAAVLAALDKFYDEVIGPLDIQYVPNIVEPYVDNMLKKLVMQMADGGIDAFVTFLNQNNIFTKS